MISRTVKISFKYIHIDTIKKLVNDLHFNIFYPLKRIFFLTNAI